MNESHYNTNDYITGYFFNRSTELLLSHDKHKALLQSKITTPHVQTKTAALGSTLFVFYKEAQLLGQRIPPLFWYSVKYN